MTSDMTFFCKFILTPLSICGFGVEALMAMKHYGSVGPIIAWIAGATLLFLTWGSLKKVMISPFDRKLYVSNFIREIQIGFDEIEEISGSMLMRPEMINIRFKKLTPFGQSIAFMPKYRFIGGFSEHPAAAELRQIIFGK